MAETAATEAPAVALTQCPPRGRINLRGDAANPEFLAGVEEVIGVDPPSTANTGRQGPDAAILWLGPDEWVIEVPAAVETKIAESLENALSELHASVAIVGNSSVTLSLAGPRAVDVLAKGMTLDLDPDQFRAGCCARSLLAKAPVLLHRPGDGLLYEITVACSFSEYTSHWLRDAALEYVQLS